MREIGVNTSIAVAIPVAFIVLNSVYRWATTGLWDSLIMSMNLASVSQFFTSAATQDVGDKPLWASGLLTGVAFILQTLVLLNARLAFERGIRPSIQPRYAGPAAAAHRDAVLDAVQGAASALLEIDADPDARLNRLLGAKKEQRGKLAALLNATRSFANVTEADFQLKARHIAGWYRYAVVPLSLLALGVSASVTAGLWR